MSKVKIGINGFGRIGRQLTKLVLNSNSVELVAINDLADSKTSAHLFKYDTSYGIFNGDVEYKDSEIIINGNSIKKFAERDPALINWTDHEVDIVVESTGIFTKKAQAEKHISGSVKKVIISAPATDEDITIVLGVNEENYETENVIFKIPQQLKG